VKRLVRRLIRRAWSKTWTEAQIAKFVGAYRQVVFAYATDAALRKGAASGGCISALLLDLLETRQIDGALVLTTSVVDGQVVPRFLIAQTREEILRAQGSKYIAVHFPKDGLPLLRAFPGRVAVVVLPCDASVLARARSLDPALDRKVALVISLLCGHNSEPQLTEGVLRRLAGTHGPATDFRYRFGHWRGSQRATFADGASVSTPFSSFSDYQNLYFFSQRKCHHCSDHLGYASDISAGDIWSLRMKGEPIKHNALVVRTSAGEEALRMAIGRGSIEATEESIREVLDGQARTLPFHYNVSARARVGPLFGYRIRDTVQERVRWNDWLAAVIVLFNERWSRTGWGRWVIFRLPRPLLKAYLVLLKGLESL
jgi:coenzyme F420-reducing hydrogenase beta subunit